MIDQEKGKSLSQSETYSVGVKAGVFGLVCNALLFAAKLTVGVLIGSIAVTADAFNNLSDGANSAITVTGYKLAARPADREHPFGHARFEYIAALIVSVVMFMIGALFLKESLSEIFAQKGEPNVRAFAYVVLGVSVLLKVAQAAVYGLSYRKTGSLPMKAAAADSIGDVFVTSAALLSAVIRDATGLDLDGYFGAAISLFILFSAVRLLKDSVSPLLGTAPLDSLVAPLKEKILSYEGVLGVHDITIHSYGEKHAYAVAHIEVDATTSLVEAHDLADRIERDVMKEQGISLVAHIDPRAVERSATDLESLLRAYLSERFAGLSVHDFRIAQGDDRARVYFDAEIPWEGTLTEEAILSALRDFDPDNEYIVNIDKK